MTSKATEMIIKEDLIKHWEYQKNVCTRLGINSKTTFLIIQDMVNDYRKACELYGDDWAKKNLTPIEFIIEV